MILNKKYFSFENIIFYLLLLFNLINIWSVNVYTTMDGPSHLYNSSLLNVFQTSDFLKEYYIHNYLFLPNYLSHLILGKLFLFFSPVISEKFFLSGIVLLLPISFRYLVKIFSGNENGLSILIFSLVFTFLFQLGFFNFSFAFIFLNCQLILAYHILNNKNNLWAIAGFIITNLLLFYTHPFVYGVSMLTVFLYVFIKLVNNKNERLKKAITIIVLCLPSFILFLLFILKVHMPAESEFNFKDIPNKEKLAGLYNFSPGISYVREFEITYSRMISVLAGLLTLLVIGQRFFINKTSREFYITDIFLILSFLAAGSIFFTHNEILGGMFTIRLTYLAFYFLILWLACNKIESKLILLSSIFVLLFSYIKLSFVRHDVLMSLNHHAWGMIQARSAIKEKSVVFVTNYSDNWLEKHYADYAGMNKEVVISENYEAVLGWFPLKWQWDKIFRIKCEAENNSQIIIPDYVLIYGKQSKINLPANADFKKYIEGRTFKCYESPDKFCKLFKVLKQ